jgi:hypothetical protein
MINKNIFVLFFSINIYKYIKYYCYIYKFDKENIIIINKL